MLLVNDDLGVRQNFAEFYKNIIPEAQMILANDRNPNVRREFAYYNKNIIPKAQMILANDNDPEVRMTLRANPNLTPEAKAILDSRN